MKIFQKRIAYGVALLFTFTGLAVSSISYQRRQVIADHFGTANGCHSDTPFIERDLRKCTINPRGGKPIYLIGDSNAEQFEEPLIKYAKKTGRNLIVGTISGCPFLPGYVNAPNQRWPKTKSKSCDNYYISTLQYLSRAPDGVVVLAYSDQYFREANWKLGVSEKSSSIRMQEHLKFLQTGILKSTSQILSFGHRILFIFTIPQLNYRSVGGHYIEYLYNHSFCNNLKILLFQCDRSLLLNDYVKHQLPIKKIESKSLQKQGIKTLDLSSNLFAGNKLVNRKLFNWTYRDGAHLTVAKSLQLVSIFEANLKNL